MCSTFQTPWTEAHQPPSFHGISQARILEWIAISFSRGSSQPRDQTQTDPGSPLHCRRILTEPPGKPIGLLTLILQRWELRLLTPQVHGEQVGEAKVLKSPCYRAPAQLVLRHPCVPALPLYSPLQPIFVEAPRIQKNVLSCLGIFRQAVPSHAFT